MDIFVARQPIFDVARDVYAYELLFRSGPENFFSHGDYDYASRSVIDNAFHVFGLDTLSGAKKLFLNCTRKILLEDIISLMPVQTAVVEVLETVTPDDETLGALRLCKERGYLVALDDFVFKSGMEPLVELADIIKVDFLATPEGERAQVVKRFGRPGLKFLAEKVETLSDFDTGKAQGYSYFQGYFFAKPQMMNAKDVPSSKLSRLRLLRTLMAEDINFDELEQTLKSDLSLSVKLLRYLNSAAFGWREHISSLKHALILLGARPFRKWASMMVMTMLGDDKPAELILTCLIRARFCEQLGHRIGMAGQAFELFLTGLLSSLDALLGRPLDELLQMLAVPASVRNALLNDSGELAPILKAVSSYQRGEWENPALGDLSARVSNLPEEFQATLDWAQSLMVG